jgi:hypothetical protein
VNWCAPDVQVSIEIDSTKGKGQKKEREKTYGLINLFPLLFRQIIQRIIIALMCLVLLHSLLLGMHWQRLRMVCRAFAGTIVDEVALVPSSKGRGVEGKRMWIESRPFRKFAASIGRTSRK